jgi:hypothetical protein
MYHIIEINVLRADVLNALLFNLMLQQIFILNGHYFNFHDFRLFLWRFERVFLLHRGADQKSVCIFDLLLQPYVKC